ncbi:uncharacterized protein METZ01_LOCUS84724 [marine metagenome]|jgi:hypothetical protein|uniref:Uncharacterized protein n=1 Tax=marine metagenome TaxID=408172 RepID=A0A381UUT5_9ZZZZ
MRSWKLLPSGSTPSKPADASLLVKPSLLAFRTEESSVPQLS